MSPPTSSSCSIRGIRSAPSRPPRSSKRSGPYRYVANLDYPRGTLKFPDKESVSRVLDLYCDDPIPMKKGTKDELAALIGKMLYSIERTKKEGIGQNIFRATVSEILMIYNNDIDDLLNTLHLMGRTRKISSQAVIITSLVVNCAVQGSTSIPRSDLLELVAPSGITPSNFYALMKSLAGKGLIEKRKTANRTYIGIGVDGI